MCTVQRWTAMSGQRRQRAFETRRAVDDDQPGAGNPRRDEIVEQRAPGRLAFSAHALDRQQHLPVKMARTPSAISNVRIEAVVFQ